MTVGISFKNVVASFGVVVAGLASGYGVASVGVGSLLVPTRWDRGSAQLTASVVAVALALLLRAATTPSESATARWLTLRDVAPTPGAMAVAQRFVPRTRFGRTAGGVIGAFAVFVPGTLTNFVEGPLQRQLVDLVPWLDGNLPILVGYAIGAVVAELQPRVRRNGQPRRAELSPRDVTAYVWWLGRFGPPALAALSVLLWVLVGDSSRSPGGIARWPPAAGIAVAIVLALLAEVAYRQIVERPQAAPEPAAVAADDAARASSAHAVSGTALASQLVLVAHALGRLAEQLSPEAPRLPLWLLGALLHTAAFGVWFGFGTHFVWTVSGRRLHAQPS